MNPAGNLNRFTPECNLFGTINQFSPKGSTRLETGDYQVTIATPDIVFQMLLDPTMD